MGSKIFEQTIIVVNITVVFIWIKTFCPKVVFDGVLVHIAMHYIEGFLTVVNVLQVHPAFS